MSYDILSKGKKKQVKCLETPNRFFASDGGRGFFGRRGQGAVSSMISDALRHAIKDNRQPAQPGRIQQRQT